MLCSIGPRCIVLAKKLVSRKAGNTPSLEERRAPKKPKESGEARSKLWRRGRRHLVTAVTPPSEPCYSRRWGRAGDISSALRDSTQRFDSDNRIFS